MIMKGAFLVLILATVSSGIQYDGFRAHFAYTNKDVGGKYFFNLPRTLSQAKAEGWKLTQRPPGPLPELSMYCYPKRLVCLLFAPTGFVAGLQVGFPVETVNAALKPERYFTKWSPPATATEMKRDYWTSTQYYVTKDSIKAGLPKISDGATLQAGGVWVNDPQGNLMQITLAEEDLMRTLPVYKKQACVPKMGTHFYYNMTKQLDCNEIIIPWYALMSTNGKLHGVGFQTFGTLPPGVDGANGTRMWFEPLSPNRNVPLGSMPDAADCILDNHAKYNTLSLHIYFIEKPWEIKCK